MLVFIVLLYPYGSFSQQLYSSGSWIVETETLRQSCFAVQ